MTEEEELSLTVDVSAGMSNSDTIKFEQIADEAIGHVPGDLIFVINQVDHELFSRVNDDLYMTITISLLESLTGFSKTFNHLDGHQFTIDKTDVSSCSEVVTVRSEGMPRKGNSSVKGNLHVILFYLFIYLNL
jgi:DnaJ-class molecular chaperone